MFGMGTGGSLRLLSPEIWGCQGGAPRFASLSVCSASRFPGSLHFASLSVRSASLPFPRTLKTAQVRFHFALSDLDAAPLLPSTFFKSSSLVSGPVLRSLLRSRASNPSSLLLTPSSQDQALDRLVSPSSIHCCTSTDDLSTLSSSRGLTHF